MLSSGASSTSQSLAALAAVVLLAAIALPLAGQTGAAAVEREKQLANQIEGIASRGGSNSLELVEAPVVLRYDVGDFKGTGVTRPEDVSSGAPAPKRARSGP